MLSAPGHLQDKVKTMEDQLSEAYVEVAKLKEENTTLAGRNSILEKVLALRDQQLQQAARGQVRPRATSNVPHWRQYPGEAAGAPGPAAAARRGIGEVCITCDVAAGLSSGRLESNWIQHPAPSVSSIHTRELSSIVRRPLAFRLGQNRNSDPNP